MEFLSTVIYILLLSLIELLYLFGILIAVGLLLGVLERYSNTFLIRALGPKGVLVTAWIGTPIHEIGHLIQCFIWGHQVKRVKLLQLNSPDGVLGYVEHQYNANSIYQQVGNFFIGLGPIFSGIGSLIFAMFLLVPHSFTTFTTYIHQQVAPEKLDINVVTTAGRALFAISKSLFTLENLINPLFWIFLFLAICISSHIALSKADIRGSAKGFFTIFFVLALINAIAEIIGFDSYPMIVKIAEYNAYISAFSSIAILFSMLTLVMSYFLYQWKKR